jgi:hypothetical protein
MQRPALCAVLLTSLLAAGATAQDRPSRWRAAWRWSQVLLVSADAADIASSWGKNEANPLLRSGQRFGYGSLAIKLGALGGCLAAQHLIVPRHPERTPMITSVNFAVAGGLTVVAARNVRVPKTK